LVKKRGAGRPAGRDARAIGPGDGVAGALLLAALVEAQGARADGIDPRTLLAELADRAALTAAEAQLLQLAVALEAPELLTADELAAVLDPGRLLDLGLTPEFIADLLDDGPALALQRLKEAFGPKLKAALASVERKAFGDEAQLIKAAASSASGDGAAAGGAAAAGGTGLSPLALLAGVAGLGAIGVAVGGGGGGSSGNSPANVNDAPTTSPDSIAAVEDSAVTFDVRSNDSDADGDALTVTAINGTAITPATPVTLAGIGTLALNADGTLTFTPLPNFNGAPSFTYTVSDGRGGTATGTATLNVAAVNDAPVNSVPAAALAATAGTAVAVGGLSVADVDGGSVTTTLSLGAGQGSLAAVAVAGGATITGSGTASLTLAGTLAQVNASLGTVTFTSASGFAGTATLTISTSDGVATDVDTRPILVARVQTGVVSDGYIAGGTVFIDVNGNGVLDAGEPQTTTNANGSYSFASNAVGPIVAFGGTNIDTGLPNLVKLTAPVGSTVVNPLTTIVQSLVATGVPADQATAQVAIALGLPPTTNLGSYDILAQPPGDPVAVAAQKAATQIVTLLNTARDAGGAANAATVEAAVVAKLAAAVMAGGGTAGALDLTSTSTLTSLLSNIDGLPASMVSSVAAKSAAINQIIQKASDFNSIAVSVVATSAPNVNLAAATTPDAISTNPGGAVTFDVRGNDIDPEGDLLSVTAIDGTALQVGSPVAVTGGTFVLNADGTLTYTAATNFVGTPSFTYTVTDARGATATGTINASVAAAPSSFSLTQATLASVVDNAAGLFAQGVRELDVDGPASAGALTISEAQAARLIDAGLEFADGDTITLSAAATQLSNSLQSLQSLGVDSIAVASALSAVDIDSGSLAALSTGGLPQFDVARSDASLAVTLNVDGATGAVPSDLFAGVADPLALIAALGDAAVDRLDINGEELLGSVRLSDGQASALVAAGIDFADSDSITVVTAGTQLATSLADLQALGVDVVAAAASNGVLTVAAGADLAVLAAGGALPQFDVAQTDAALDVTLDLEPGDAGALSETQFLASLAAAGIDHLDLGGEAFAGAFELSDADAATLVANGLDFAANDVIGVFAAGTLLATDLGDLQRLGVDSVDAEGATVLTVGLGAGGLDGLAALPQFNVAQADGALDVTLEIGAGAFADDADLGTLLGVDLLRGLTTPDLYGDLIAALLAAGIDRIDITASGRVELADGLADVLIALEGFTADAADLVLNATGSGDLLRTSLHEMAHLGVDAVEIDDQGAAPVYVHFGDGPLDEDALLAMLDALDSDDDDGTPLFTGSSDVALVVDQSTAEAIAQAAGALDKLAELGFTEITVLDGVDNSVIGLLESGPLEVKLIGQGDDLYDHLNP
jgi:hypothetical protein